MGQASSVNALSLPSEPPFQAIQGEVIHQSKRILAAAVCNYDEFLERITELNAICSRLTTSCGKRLLFGIKKGTDQTFLWKATVRITIIHWDIATAKIVSSRFVTLPQFLHLFSTIQDQFVSVLPNPVLEDLTDPSLDRNDQTISLVLDQVLNFDEESTDPSNECSICMERKIETMLPCAHAFCVPCIEEWVENKQSCPICRVKIETTDDSWVIPHAPGAEYVNSEICSTLMKLAVEPR